MVINLLWADTDHGPNHVVSGHVRGVHEQRGAKPGSWQLLPLRCTHLRLWRLSLPSLAGLLLLLLTSTAMMFQPCVKARMCRPSQGWALPAGVLLSGPVSALACGRRGDTGTGPPHPAVLHSLADQTREWAQTMALAHNNWNQ